MFAGGTQECEIRQHNPSVLIVRLGTNDNGTDDAFERAIRHTIEYSMDEGIIPVLSTKADRFEGTDNRNNKKQKSGASRRPNIIFPLWDFDIRYTARSWSGNDNVHLTAALS
ncbi:MAG: hypothetical protein R3C44_21825 [Chloroflexota bacterium]